MPLVSTSIPNLLNGVSQQPSSLRQVTQGETQTNALSSVIDGLIKRPPTEHLAKVKTSSVSNAAIHLIDRGVGKRHILVVETNASTPSVTLNMFDVAGNSIPVKDANGNTISGINYTGSLGINTYLGATNAQTDLEFLTVADFTFILNNKKTVSMKTTTVSGTLITNSKYQGFDDLPVETSTYHVGGNSTVRFPVGFKFHDTADLTVKVGASVKALGSSYFLEDNNKTIRFSSAPGDNETIVFTLDPPVGDIIEVIGDEGNAFDSFYVKSVSKNAYEETVKPGIKFKIDEKTMPMALTPVYSGSTVTHFTLDWVNWTDRTVGDLDSATNPSLVDKK